MPGGSWLPELGPRGEGWVVLQPLLFAAIAGCGFVGVYWPGSVESFFGVLGLLIAVAGVLLVVLGVLALGSSFTPLPRPRTRTRLRQHGIFGLVRHPVYGA
jgi:protein-S-isoprenylcysteine O-methyltransferase Ste14